MPISESSSSISVKQVWKICRTKSLRGTSSSACLNQLLEKAERDGKAKDKQIADLQAENTSEGSNSLSDGSD